MYKRQLLGSVQDTYNMVSIDGDTSTNDMVTLLANGAAAVSYTHLDVYKRQV